MLNASILLRNDHNRIFDISHLSIMHKIFTAVSMVIIHTSKNTIRWLQKIFKELRVLLWPAG